MQNSLREETTAIKSQLVRLERDFDDKYDKYLGVLETQQAGHERTWELNSIKRRIEIEKKKIVQNEQQMKVFDESIRRNEDGPPGDSRSTRAEDEDDGEESLEKMLKETSSGSQNAEASGFVWSAKSEKIFCEAVNESEYDFKKAVRLLASKLKVAPIWNEKQLRAKWTEMYLRKTHHVAEQKENKFDELD